MGAVYSCKISKIAVVHVVVINNQEKLFLLMYVKSIAFDCSSEYHFTFESVCVKHLFNVFIKFWTSRFRGGWVTDSQTFLLIVMYQ